MYINIYTGKIENYISFLMTENLSTPLMIDFFFSIYNLEYKKKLHLFKITMPITFKL